MTEKITIGKPIHCKAAIARAAGQELVIEEVVVAPPKSHEVRLKIICTSLCHTDVTLLHLKEPPGYFPRILGHEAVGIVESIGEDVNEFEVGDFVVPVFLANCGDCIDCKSKKSNLCSNMPFRMSPYMPRDDTSRFTDANGEVLYHAMDVSSFSEYTVVDVGHLAKIDPDIPPNRACLLSCGISTGVGAAWKVAKVEEGSTVAIFGLGAIGLAVAEGARICGATRIIGVDVNPAKFEMGKKFGLTDFVNPKETESVSEAINKMTDGGADYCFECVGISSLVEEAFACCRKGWGKTVILGVDRSDARLNIGSHDVLDTGRILTGSVFGGIKAKSDIPTLVKWYLDKKLQLDEFVTHEMKFEEINKAFELLHEGKCLRCVLWMNE
ncbi:hypothetical protein RND81_01G005800 [Saponaria officinalis]|uniref:Alcohol dehydrogenase-like 7 n=1 Tax=Saponaria officinalis TaxID=3572 RepID=A0AAW1N868_SAPOF